MQVSVESNGVLERRMTVQVPSERIDREVEKRLRTYAKTVRIDGFRRGKVPVKIVRKRFGDGVRQEAVGEVIETTFFEALKEQELAPVGAPDIKPDRGEEGDEHFSYTATFEVMPEVKLADRADFAFEQVSAEVAEADVDAMLEQMRAQRRTWTEVDRAAAVGDRTTIDYEIRNEEGELEEDAGAEADEAVLGEGELLTELERGLEGVRAGERREVDVTYPDDHHDEALRGKTHRFEVVCRKVEEVVLPEVDDEAFIRSFNVEEGSVAALRKQVESNLRRGLEDRIRSINKTAVLDVLVKSHPIPVPKALVEEEIHTMQENQRKRFQFALPPRFFKDQAERRLLLGLILREIIQSNDITADPERVEAWIAREAEDYEDPQEFVDVYHDNPELMEQAEGIALEAQVVEWVCEGAQITQTHKTFDEIMNPEPKVEAEPESNSEPGPSPESETPSSDDDEGKAA